MDHFYIDRRWSKFLYKDGREQDVCDTYEWRDYYKEVEGGRYQVWKNDRRTGWNYTPATIEEMLDKMKKVAAQCYQ